MQVIYVESYIRSTSREKWSRMGKKAIQSTLVSRLSLLATGAPSHWGHLGSCPEHTSKLSHLRVQKLGCVFTNSCLLQAENSFRMHPPGIAEWATLQHSLLLLLQRALRQSHRCVQCRSTQEQEVSCGMGRDSCWPEQKPNSIKSLMHNSEIQKTQKFF